MISRSFSVNVIRARQKAPATRKRETKVDDDGVHRVVMHQRCETVVFCAQQQYRSCLLDFGETIDIRPCLTYQRPKRKSKRCSTINCACTRWALVYDAHLSVASVDRGVRAESKSVSTGFKACMRGRGGRGGLASVDRGVRAKAKGFRRHEKHAFVGGLGWRGGSRLR